MRGKFDDLALRDTPDLVQVQAALALNGFRILGGTAKGVKDHDDRGNRGGAHGKYEFRIRRQCDQSRRLRDFRWDPRTRWPETRSLHPALRGAFPSTQFYPRRVNGAS